MSGSHPAILGCGIEYQILLNAVEIDSIAPQFAA